MTRSCTRCSKPLSVYNDGSLCGACEVADRVGSDRGDTIDLPLTFWFRPEVRAALSRWEWGAVLVAVRSEARASQTELATAVGLSQAQVSRLMSGRSRDPGIRTVLAIVDGLGVPRLLAGLAPRGFDHLTAHVGDDKDAGSVGGVKRRAFGRTFLGITLAIPLADTARGEPVDVTSLAPNDVVADLYALDDRYGGAAIAGIARRRLTGLKRQIDNAVLAPDVESRLQSMVGELATCCAWLAYDSGDLRGARAFDTEALYAAHLANDKDLQVEVLANMSMQARRVGKPAEAINLAESGMTIARGSDPRLKALLSIRTALASAQQNDKGAFSKARRQAWSYLERARRGDVAAWFGFFDERELAALEAIGLMGLGEHAEAAELLADVIDRQHTYMRNKAYYFSVRAQALVAAGSLDEAVDVIYNALPVFTEVTSARTFDRLRLVRTGLNPCLADPAIAECDEILEGLVT